MRLADEVATVGRIEASVDARLISTRTRARSAKTLVAGDETREPDQAGALAVEG